MPSILVAVLAGLLLVGCRSDSQGPIFGDAPRPIVLTLAPDAPLDSAPRVVRLRATLPESAALERVVLVRGDLSSARLAELARGDLSKAFRDKLVPAIVWRTSTDVVLAPTVPLDPGETYSFASGEPRFSHRILIATEDSTPLATRFWPPEKESATTTFAVWCAREPLPSVDEAIALEPLGPAGRARRGIGGVDAPACVTFRADGEGPSGPLLAPPLVEGVRLEPSPLARAAPPPRVEPIECASDEVPFGLGCARIEDDRARVRSPPSALLWMISGEGLALTRANAAHEPFAFADLPPSSSIELIVRALDLAGREHEARVSAVTLAPRPHLVLNEELADPAGPEPAGEWVEIKNDGSVAGDLEGLSLVDGGGATLLPAATIPAGAFVLVVNDAYAPIEGVDPSPAKGTIVVRVPKLGTHGLANMGEPLALVDAKGRTLSRLPATPKPASGKSLSRRNAWDADDAPSSFALGKPTPGAPNESP